MKCDVCNQSVKVVGDTTKHYEGMEREKAIEECAELLEKSKITLLAAYAVKLRTLK